MILKTRNKIICAVLTAALAFSPVFVAPSDASDGQDVEMQASSWRYQDGDIIIDEDLGECISDEDVDPEMLEDYNAQMGSSIQEEQSGAADVKAADPVAEQTEGPAAAAPEETAEAPEADAAVTAEGTAPAEAAEPAGEAAPAEMAAPAEAQAPAEAAETPEAADGTLTAKAEEPAAEAAETAEPEMTAKSATAKDRYWRWSDGSLRGPGYLKGIDVSYWQHNIDWAKVKKAGVDFAILRCGFGTSSDSTFARNVAGCVKNGIPYGVYLYSYANTDAKATKEADNAIKILKDNNCRPGLPVYYDMEDEVVGKASDSRIVSMANIFCSKLRSSGYPAGVYASLSWWNGKLAGFNGYDKWVAQWASRCDYAKDYSIWQCSSKATVSGISGNVDANLLMWPKSRMDEYMKYGGISYSFANIDGQIYLVSSLGDYVKNRFFKYGAYTYGFDVNGVMQKNRKLWIGNAAYILDGQGRAYINKSKTKKKTPYYANPGSGKKGKLKKGKSFYVLRTSGKWSQMANGYWIKTSKIKKTAIYPEFSPNVSVGYKAKLKKKTVSRSGPSNGYIKKKTFKKNKTVTVVGTYGSWSKISSGQWLPSSRLKRK